MRNNKKYVLIVEDDKSQSTSFERIVSQIPYDYISLTSGKEALNHIKDNKNVGLILLDLALIDIGGFEFLEKAKKISKTPIIILTANEEPQTAFKAAKLGAEDYFIKWKSQKELKRLVEAIIRNMEKKS